MPEWAWRKVEMVLSKDDVGAAICAFEMEWTRKISALSFMNQVQAESYIQESWSRKRWRNFKCDIAGVFMTIKKFFSNQRKHRRKEKRNLQKANLCRRQLLDALGGNRLRARLWCLPLYLLKKLRHKIVMELVRKNPNRFTQDELNQEAMIALNKTAGKNCSVNIYEHSDMDEIISQFLRCKKSSV